MAIDDCPHIRVLKVSDARNQTVATQFLDDMLRRLALRVHVVQTDHGAEFQSRFHWHLEARDIRHVYIRPRTPHLKGKVEPSHRVDDQEFYELIDVGGLIQLPPAARALDGQTPYQRLLAKTRAGLLRTSYDLTQKDCKPARGLEPRTC